MSVIQELMSHDLNVVLNSRNKVTDSTPLHIATEGGHFDVVKKLLDNGASASDENKAGLTPIHIAGKFFEHSAMFPDDKTPLIAMMISIK